MQWIFLISLFFTIFLIMLAITLRNQSDTDAHADNSPLTFKDALKKANQQLKLLLLRKKKTTRNKARLEQQISAAGLSMKVEEFIIFKWFAVIIIGGIFHLIFNDIFLVLVGAIIGLILPGLWLKRKQAKRLKEFNAGLPGMLTSIIGSLRAGFSFPQSLQMVGEESYSPIKEEVQHVLKAMQYGTSIEEALVDWKKRMPSDDLSLLVEAILIQRQVGGNLAYLLDKIVETTRERTKIENQIKTLTAQGRLSGIIISLLPVVLGIIIYMMNPDYIGTLFTNPIGQGMLVAAGIGGIIGFMLIRKITTIEV
ncbi:secretion system protein [Thalassobacillus devorans]|uniref:Secretion system protein n=1 Tax=Thalassobacillus devorans TaxID=279813 RepID=A0ABQ1PN94_9BACI|nr:type II secretion system F family protein [Thalassobacillus devorans]NIK30450.1 tight adherence protein B [Thalassobacillus devorans]GGD00186.1 secretion system protein [Thalassobacillus devorans]